MLLSTFPSDDRTSTLQLPFQAACICLVDHVRQIFAFVFNSTLSISLSL
jgi:hypothetical protein